MGGLANPGDLPLMSEKISNPLVLGLTGNRELRLRVGALGVSRGASLRHFSCQHHIGDI